MALDAIIISDMGQSSLSGSNPLKLTIEGETANIQVIKNYLSNKGEIKRPVEDDHISCWSSAPKLNGLHLFSYLIRDHFQVALVNNYYAEKRLFEELLSDDPIAVIISTTFIHSKQSLSTLVQEIRNKAPEIFIIVGGPFVYSSYLMFKKLSDRNYQTQPAKSHLLFLSVDDEPAVDFYIISLRGEKILSEALKNLKEGRAIHDMPNSARYTGTGYSFSRRIDDVSDAPEVHIDWNALPDSLFRTGVLPLQASNGCLHRCAFCNFTKDRRLLYVKPFETLIDELELVSNRGARYVWFVDDNFRLGKGDLNAFCRRIIDRGLSLKWMSFIRATALEKVDTALLHQAGCIEVQLGLESADFQILKNMNKHSNPEQYERCLIKLLSSGINCSCYFIFGFPGETNQTAQHTIEFIKRVDSLPLDGYITWSMFPFLLSPLSPIYEKQMREKYQLEGYMKNWKHSSMDSDEASRIVLKAFLEIENSGPIYRGDNLDILDSLIPSARKDFQVIRHRLSKLALKDQIRSNDIIESFSGIFTHSNPKQIPSSR